MLGWAGVQGDPRDIFNAFFGGGGGGGGMDMEDLLGGMGAGMGGMGAGQQRGRRR